MKHPLFPASIAAIAAMLDAPLRRETPQRSPRPLRSKMKSRRLRKSSRRDAFGEIVEAMTNHERNQWARAGYPGLKQRSIDVLRPHAQAAERRLAR